MSDSARKHREAKRMQDRIAAQDGQERAQDAPSGSDAEAEARRRTDVHARNQARWANGPERTPSQRERDRIAAQDAEVAADMRRDYQYGTWSEDLTTPAGIRDVF